MTSHADLTRYHIVHKALRGGIARLVDATAPGAPVGDDRRRKAIAKYWNGYAGEVRSHHTIEDDFVFPALDERVPDMKTFTDRTGADHVELERMLCEAQTVMDRVAGGSKPQDAGDIMAAIGAHLDEHLDFEDAEILPVIERSFTSEEYEELDAKALKAIGLGKQAAFTVPFAVAVMTPDEFESAFETAPLPMKVLWRLTRGSHARLVQRAFG
jgi:hemerythrin-like domain-containing protein